jgi:cytochrome c-type biogenesis protein CcmF
MVCAHAGVAVFIVGVTMVKSHEVERDVKMSVGDSVAIGAHRFVFRGVREVAGPNYTALRAEVEVQRDGAAPLLLAPEKRIYRAQAMPMTEAAIDVGLTRDLYVSLGEPLDEKTWTVRVYLKPFVDWIWGGALLMAIGAGLSLSDRRYRLPLRQADAAVPAQPAQEATA